jgi:hypothetical protein
MGIAFGKEKSISSSEQNVSNTTCDASRQIISWEVTDDGSPIQPIIWQNDSVGKSPPHTNRPETSSISEIKNVPRYPIHLDAQVDQAENELMELKQKLNHDLQMLYEANESALANALQNIEEELQSQNESIIRKMEVDYSKYLSDFESINIPEIEMMYREDLYSSAIRFIDLKLSQDNPISNSFGSWKASVSSIKINDHLNPSKRHIDTSLYLYPKRVRNIVCEDSDTCSDS